MTEAIGPTNRCAVSRPDSSVNRLAEHNKHHSDNCERAKETTNLPVTHVAIANREAAS